MDDDSFKAGLQGHYSGNSRDFDSWNEGNRQRLARLEEQERYQQEGERRRREEEERQRIDAEARRKRSDDLFSGYGQRSPGSSPTTTGPSTGGRGSQSIGGDEVVGLIVLTIVGLAITAWFSVEIALTVGAIIVGLILVIGALVLGLVVLFALVAALVKISATFAWALARYVASLWAWCLAFAAAFSIGALALSALGFDLAADSTPEQPTWEIAVAWGVVGLLAGCGIGMVARTTRALYRMTIRFWRTVRRRFGGGAAAERERVESFESILPSWARTPSDTTPKS